MPVFVAGLTTAMLLSINAILVVMSANVLTGRSLFFHWPSRSVELYVVVGGILLGAGSIMRSAWVSGSRFDALKKEFANSSRRREFVRTTLFWAYIALTVVLPIALAFAERRSHT